MRDRGALNQLLVALVRFEKVAAVAPPSDFYRAVSEASVPLKTLLQEELDSDKRRFGGRWGRKINILQMRRKYYYVLKQKQQLDKELLQYRSTSKNELQYHWRVAAGLSAPTSSQREVATWCRP